MVEIRGDTVKHKGKVTKLFIQKHHHSLAYNRAFYRKWRVSVRARHHVVSVASGGRLLVFTRRGKRRRRLILMTSP